MSDKWFNKSVERFNDSYYLDNLLSGNSPYTILDEFETNLEDEIILIKNEFIKVKLTPDSVLQAILVCYNKINGSIFGELRRAARTVERAWEVNQQNVLKNNPKLLQKLYDRIQKLSGLSVAELSKKISPEDQIKKQGSKDKDYLCRELERKGYLDCSGISRQAIKRFLSADKAFLSKDRTAVLKKIGIIVKKSPDFVVKHGDTIYVGENKYQIEDGGAQGLSKKDGLDIFSVENSSQFDIRRIFCFDGMFYLIARYQGNISTENKIMSIFDVVSYIESKE